MARNLAESFINTINYYKDEDDEILMIKLYNYIQEEIRWKHPLTDYGKNELADHIDYIEEEIKNGNIQDSYTLVDAIFYGACMNGTLTFSSLQAQMEVNANYDLDEINEANEYINGLDSWELIHIEFCIREFTNYFEEKQDEIKEEYPELEEQELLIKTCHSILNEE